ncbi:thioredoxin-like domain-containing protein [uncultured Megasphaera sp.]|uniref:TlpA family protein disulfide reductase n=1 Tax=uncultured Megasphaera sp. TaxID=165188 RepID=UPI00262FD036|nr:thioredoxin-like domain-containing protein [uncultured Megasphaera sp.]
MTIKTRILAGLACICLILTAFFWPGKEEDAYSSDVVREAEEVSERETEMLAPDESLQASDGEDIRLQTLYNQKPVCLFFWAAWSSDSLHQLAILESAYAQYGQAIYFVTIPVGPDRDESRTYVGQQGYHLPLYGARKQMLKEYGVHQVPQLIFIARGGQMTRPFNTVLNERQVTYEIKKMLK